MRIDLIALRDLALVLLVINIGPTPDTGLANALCGLCVFVGVPALLWSAFQKL